MALWVTDGIVKDSRRNPVSGSQKRPQSEESDNDGQGDMEYIPQMKKDGSQRAILIWQTPSNAAEALAQADKVIANADIMSENEKKQAADMQTEALKTKIDITKLTADQVAKYEALYLAVYGADNIETEPSDAVGGIAAAGLTSEDFAEGGGKVTLNTLTEWPCHLQQRPGKRFCKASGQR